ncbi:phosphotransferase [Mycolicibacterium grossiae]|uniref:Aminoglycoside phosphotransferase n=1 Tax=Mycolicibacterium grossiae TaxID=1552759 RepID=A0A1E8Q5L3_9MYCO|nr:phosphotransferase [Mycolicibacterium grossiae]OFJ53726.1 aminoglycoside phosphotransferase [Mycolicibacterium grossiae]QEM43887.1 phosphotransferase [Mycolicibacterium grossiae]
MPTDADPADRTARAVTAATAAGRALGLRVEDPRVLHDAFSVVVHLAPAPVVVRVPTVLPDYLHSEAQLAQQRSELAVTEWLADGGHPVVPPSPLVPREPVRRDGFSMTFWQFVPEVGNGEEGDGEEGDAAPDYAARIARTARLHAALRDHPGAGLGFLTATRAFVPTGLSALERRPGPLTVADLDRAQREWYVLAGPLASREAFETAFPGVSVQPIHGDAPFHNTIVTAAGELWSDFELVTTGPVEYDVTVADARAVAGYDATARQLGLRPLDARVRRVVNAAAALSAVAALSMARRLPMLTDALAPALAAWRSTPEVTAP